MKKILATIILLLLLNTSIALPTETTTVEAGSSAGQTPTPSNSFTDQQKDDILSLANYFRTQARTSREPTEGTTSTLVRDAREGTALMLENAVNVPDSLERIQNWQQMLEAEAGAEGRTEYEQDGLRAVVGMLRMNVPQREPPEQSPTQSVTVQANDEKAAQPTARTAVTQANAELARQRAAGTTGLDLNEHLERARDAERNLFAALQQEAEQETSEKYEEEKYDLQLRAQAARENAASLEMERAGNGLAFLRAQPDIESDDPDLIAVEREYENARQEAAEARQQAEILKFEKNNFLLKFVAVATSLLKAYREFAGLATLGSLFIDDEELDKRRNQIDERFCDSILFGGVKCWTSKICDGYIDTEPGGSALIARGLARTPFGFAHIEAEKSLPIKTVEEGRKVTLVQYKVTYSLTNPLDKPLFYNVEFSSQDKTVKVFGEDVTVGEGLSDGRLGGSALIPPLSSTDYTSVCLTWAPAITSFDGKRESRFCVPISQYEGAATRPYEQATTVSVAGKQVTIQGFRYSPNIITIDEGESITWTNQDDTPHTVTVTQGPETFDSGELAAGQQFSFTFTKPGTYSYECNIHTAMKGSIHVKPAAAAQPTTAPEKKEDFRQF